MLNRNLYANVLRKIGTYTFGRDCTFSKFEPVGSEKTVLKLSKKCEKIHSISGAALEWVLLVPVNAPIF